MTQAGGPAAINGFLYQIIHHIGWLAGIALTGKLEGQDVTDACLVLEPKNGGDARAEASGVYLVEQYKTRKEGTWAVADIELVLRDLRKSIPNSRPESACYRFVTDGRAGKLSAFSTFYKTLAKLGSSDELDNNEPHNFGRSPPVTYRAFFDHLVEVTRSAKFQSGVEERADVFHLLSHFDMQFNASGDERAKQVERLLRRYVPDLGDERSIRERLVGVLVEKLSKGQAKLDVTALEALFQDVGLSPKRLVKLAQLAERMGAITHQRLERMKFRAEADVRSIPVWPENKSVLLITGESGTGKTWQFGRLLLACAEERGVVSLTPAANRTDDMLARAARDVWLTGLGETTEKSLTALSNFLREIGPGTNVPRLTVAIDNVQDVDVARDLVQQDWSNLGMRLVLTVPSGLARALELTDGDTIHVHRVGQFTVDELDALFKFEGQRWIDLPPDLQQLLRSPILAGLYLKLPYTSFSNAPRSEYEIFDGFWRRLEATGFGGDAGLVMALAAHMYEGKSYPVPRPFWVEIALTDEAFARLEAVGWLLSNESGEVAFAHDRLLNWAVAKDLARRFRRKDLSVENLGELLSGKNDQADRRLAMRLGYVPMDTLWLLTADHANVASLSRLLVRLEDSQQFGSYGNKLYVDLLPTLGQSIVNVLRERLRVVTDELEGAYRASLIGKSFAKLASQEGVDLKDTINWLLSSESRDLHAVALIVLAVEPKLQYLDRVWAISQRHKTGLEQNLDESYQESRRRDYVALTVISTALRAGIEKYPEWLRNCILEFGSTTESVSELADLLKDMKHPSAAAIWQATKAVLLTNVPVSKARSLLACIARFADKENFNFVLGYLACPDGFTGGAAFAALAVLDPNGAIDRLVDGGDSERYLFRDRWLPVLLHAQPTLTRQRLRQLAETDGKGWRLIETLFSERPDEIDEEMLRFMLRTIEADLRDGLEDAIAGDPTWLMRPLGFFERIARPELIAILEGEAGGELERMITAVACSRLRTNSRCYDHVRESARRVLILIGGEGFSTLINRELESEHFWVRIGGLKWAFIRADDQCVDKLKSIARRSVSRDSNGALHAEFVQEFQLVMTALAALGADEILIEVLWDSAFAGLPSNIAYLRSNRGPMPKSLTEQALRTMESKEPAEDLLVTALLTAWLSGDTELISVVRSILDRADPNCKVAGYACIALQYLGDQSVEFVLLAKRLISTRENTQWGLEALCSLGPRGAEAIGQWLNSRAISGSKEYDGLAIRILYDNAATRKHAVGLAVDYCRVKSELRWLQRHSLYDIAAEASDSMVRDKITFKAFGARSIESSTLLNVIEGLAKFDVDRAVEAIELAYGSHPTLADSLCRLLVRLTPERATNILINVAISTENGSLRRAIGRALRRLDPLVVSSQVIACMDGTAPARKVAAELAGWLPIPDMLRALDDLARHDGELDVRLAALTSLEYHRREETVLALLTAFQSATLGRRWTLFVTALDVGDPYLLGDCDDPLWYGKILSEDNHAMFEHYASSVLLQRQQREDK